LPRIPTYQPGQVGPVEVTSARFRAPDMGQSGLGQGLQQLGGAVQDYAHVQDAINAQNDETQAMKMAAQAQGQFSAVTQQFKGLLGTNARVSQPDALAQLDKTRSDLLAQATNPRMGKLLERHLDGYYADASAQITGHALQQAQVEHTAALGSAIEASQQAAIGADNPAKRLGYVQQAIKATNDKLDFLGVADPNARALNILDTTTHIHTGIIDTMLAGTNPDVQTAAAYLAAHRDQMTAHDIVMVERDLQKPLQDEMADLDLHRAVAGLANAAPSAPGTPGDAAARMTAITAQSESGNRDKNPDGSWVTSPKGAMGRMQVMPSTARDPGYGIKPWNGKDAEDLARVGVEKQTMLMKRYGDPAKAWAAYNWGEGNVDKAIADRGAAWMSDPNMPAETRAYVRKNMAALAGHTDQAPQHWDKDAVYNRIDSLAKSEDWTWERTERAKRRADQVVSRDEELLHRQRDAADESALRTVISLGDKFTSIAQIPQSVRYQLSPEAYARYSAKAEANATPAPVKADGIDKTNLDLLRIYEPEKFMSKNLGEFVGKLTPAEMNSFLVKQAEMRTNAQNPHPVWTPNSGISEAVNYGKRIGGLQFQPQEEAAIMQTMEAEANRLHAAGKPIDFNSLFQHATRNVAVSGMFGSSQTPLYDLSLSNMRDDQRAELVGKFRREMGRPPNDDELLRLYRVMKR